MTYPWRVVVCKKSPRNGSRNEVGHTVVTVLRHRPKTYLPLDTHGNPLMEIVQKVRSPTVPQVSRLHPEVVQSLTMNVILNKTVVP